MIKSRGITPHKFASGARTVFEFLLVWLPLIVGVVYLIPNTYTWTLKMTGSTQAAYATGGGVAILILFVASSVAVMVIPRDAADKLIRPRLRKLAGVAVIATTAIVFWMLFDGQHLIALTCIVPAPAYLAVLYYNGKAIKARQSGDKP